MLFKGDGYIWTLPEGDADFSSRWGLIKRQVSIHCREHYRRAVWLNRF